MIDKPTLLIVNRAQFGYHIDTYKYCQYLKDVFNITYLGWDYGLSKIASDNVAVKYVSRDGDKGIRYFRFLRATTFEISKLSYDLIFLDYFPGASLIRILNLKNRFIVDIRTRSIGVNRLKNFLADLILRFETAFFRNVTIISRGLAASLKIQTYHLLPLGGECFCKQEKSFNNFHLLYVGTLEGRNILDCVKGFHKYLESKDNARRHELFFTIIGDSPGMELKEINRYIIENQLQKYIKTVGYIHNDKLYDFFTNANLGVSYVPVTEYFTNQPPTKTFEYLLSGLPVIATKTNENIKILHENCGILIDNNIAAFSEGLSSIVRNRHLLTSDKIRGLYEKSLWKNIVGENLYPYMLNIIEGKQNESRL